MNTDIPLRILFVEDVPADAELAARILSKEGLAFTSIRVETQEEFLNALIEYRPDLILSDYSLPQFDGMRALRLALAHNVNLPFIIVTGSIDEETAVDCIKAGAWDYVLKERMARLPFAAKSALERRKIRLSQAESAVMLRESERRYREIFNATNEAIFIDDAATGQMIDVNDAMLRMYGYSSKQEVLAGSIGDLSANRPPYSQAEAEQHLRRTLEQGPQTFEWLARKRSGEEFWTEVSLRGSDIGGKGRILAVVRDITERKAAETAIHHLAYFDALTGLPNRRLFRDRLNQALAAAQRSNRWGAVLFVDLDQFKQINDARGHDVGDLLLKQVSERLNRCRRDEDTVARQGGDEFVVLLVHLAAPHSAAIRLATRVAEKIRDAASVPFQIGGLDYHIGVSIGITVFPKATENVDDLLREADTAMYRAKEAGRNTVSYFEPAMQEAVQARFALEHDLRQALARNEMRLLLQPQVDGQGRFVGAEALVRWERPGQGLVSPMVFIPVAEESGIILALGRWVLEEACRLLKQLDAAGHILRLAVNVSPRQFRQPDFVACVCEVLQTTGADPTHLVLEVTEGLVIENIHDTIAKMMELNRLGIRFSIDDFGTGYSSLAYLKRLPLHELKIDRTFVQDAPTDPNDAALVETILAVARHLNLSVVAEGVETKIQLDFLKQRGCEVFQGYFFDRPLLWPHFQEKAFLQMR